ncbi:hypothetical protein PAMP_017992 [Pampus punctatissimus]
MELGSDCTLYRGSYDSGDLIYFNTDFAMKYLRDNGTPVEKLRMGFATYGRTFRLASSNTGVGAPAGFWSYYEICTFLKGTTVQWIDDQKVPYASKNNEWVGFDNRESYEIKICLHFHQPQPRNLALLPQHQLPKPPNLLLALLHQPSQQPPNPSVLPLPRPPRPPSLSRDMASVETSLMNAQAALYLSLNELKIIVQ